MSRNFAIIWSPEASLDVLSARAFLGTARAAELDDELERVVRRLSALPESAPPVEKRRAQWDFSTRKKTLIKMPYALFYRLDFERQQIVIVGLRHQRSRPPRL